MDYLEIAPGIAVVEDVLTFCPGCGMEVMGGDPTSLEDVTAWFLAVYAVVTMQGGVGYTPDKARKSALGYIANPWHMESGEGEVRRGK